MAKKNQKRKIVGLVSEASGHRIYTTKRNDGEKISLKKFDSKTRQHELFTETKKNLGRNEVKKRKK